MMKKLRIWLLTIIVLTGSVLSIGIVTPVMTQDEKPQLGSTWTGTPVVAPEAGEPQLESTLIGNNEFTVGQSSALQIMVQNKGLFTGQKRNPNDSVTPLGYSSSVGVAQLPRTTAFGITATLKSSTQSIQIVSGSAGIGTLSVGMSMPQPTTYQLRVAEDAQPGTYQLELELEYQFLDTVVWLNPGPTGQPYYASNYKYTWNEKIQTQEISIKVTGTCFSVQSVKTEAIRAGATGTITATIENSGDAKVTKVTAEIVPGGDLVPVDKGVFLGDLNSGESKVAAFRVTVSPEVIAKTSPLDIAVNYDDENGVARQTVMSIGVPIEAGEDDFLVTRVETEGVRAGTTGIITVTLKNNTAGQAHGVSAEILPGGYFVPVDKGSFLGDIKNGDSGTTQFKVSIAQDAIAKTSPLDILIKYKDENNVPLQATVTIGVPVEQEPEFEIQSVKIDGKLTPGAERVIEIPIKNVSDYELQDAIARINIVDPFATAPFSTTDDTAYIGTLQPGENGTGKFKISVDAEALPKAYVVEVEIKYWDSFGNSYISQPVKAIITVQPPSGLTVTTIVLISVIAIVLIIGILYFVRRSKKPVQSN